MKDFNALLATLRSVSFELWIVYINIMLYAMCYQMQVPVLPYLTKRLGSDTQGYGNLQMGFGVVQFFGGLLAGPLADVYSGELLLFVSFLASALCYTFTASASGMWMLYLSRIPTLLQHAVLAARIIVTGRTNEMERAKTLGYIGLAYGIGFAFGPAIGGWLGSHWLFLTAWVAVGGSLLSLVLLAFYLPGSITFQHKGRLTPVQER
ncbi:hypothetical protein CYMTET_9134 [Cymbomonas tetramitiformis]|uniref:Major facilitator superfamily (MFS) profile domain-containing protein n=1 Tax=Cymbomonas tetramitiformis TaxID=36881 RepID=A0AAE0LFB8_9CHLO|nr:hypothetical protein CYMTET_9134 [Cymbomonas tetramitiformis]